MELSNVGDRVFAAERILKKRIRRVGVTMKLGFLVLVFVVMLSC